ncbi:MAG: hypothetical protein L6N95_01970 [Candidatus Methylarchaceae archaeon HK01B]|nr:hypothetical protein [Candidatus Methylarchaceae archaeon HK01B]
MGEAILDRIYRLIESESKSDRVEKIPKSLYKEVAIHMNKIMKGINQSEKSIMSNLAFKERELIGCLIDRLFDLRIKKVQSIDDTEYLTPEERYIIEPLSLFTKRLKKVSRAIKNGQSSRLEKISDIVSSRFTIVKFLQPTPSIIGIDLKKYGPFKEEDIAVIPLENARPLIKQKIVSEVWVDDS